MTKWISITEVKPFVIKKTKTFWIVTKEGNQHLGIIQWYAPWRKYSFFPKPDTVWETQCLKDVTAFIENLMVEHKKELQNRKKQDHGITSKNKRRPNE